MTDSLLMVPGPTNLPAQVREALAQPAIYHRGEAFAAILDECTRGLQALMGTAQPVLILTSSGTGAVEAMVLNTVKPGSRVLAVCGGKFGERIGEIAAGCGARVDSLELAPGEAASPQQVDEALGRGNYSALMFVCNETSTGVKHDCAALAQAAQRHGVMVLADAVSAIAGMPLAMDEAGIDGLACGSQKALMLPPGLAFAALSERAWAVAESLPQRGYYFDLVKARASLAKGQTPYTPNVSLIVALQAALRLIAQEGVAAFQARHRKLAAACRAGATAAGLRLLVRDERYASEVVTAMWVPEGMDGAALVKQVAQRHGIVISGGQDALKGKIVRIGHLGSASLADLQRTWQAVAVELGALGHPCDGAAISAAVSTAYEETV